MWKRRRSILQAVFYFLTICPVGTLRTDQLPTYLLDHRVGVPYQILIPSRYVLSTAVPIGELLFSRRYTVLYLPTTVHDSTLPYDILPYLR